MPSGPLGLPWWLWSALAFGLALLFTRVWPRERAAGRGRLGGLVLRWGHALVWLLLAAGFLLRGFNWAGPADLLSAAAGFCYLVFLAALLRR